MARIAYSDASKSSDRTRDILMDFHNRYPGRIVPLVRDRNLGMMRNLAQAG